MRKVTSSILKGGYLTILPAITYPFEFAKTRAQLQRQLPTEKKLPWPKFPSREWYTGCTTLIVGNAIKAGVRKNGLYISIDPF